MRKMNDTAVQAFQHEILQAFSDASGTLARAR